MYVETVPNRNSRPAMLLREGWREGGRVRKRTLANLTDWPAEKVQCLRRVLKGQRLVSPEEAFTIERSLPHGHVEAVLAMTRRLGLDRLIAPKRSPQRDRVLAMIVGRLLHPGSKLATARRWRSTTLAQELDLGDAVEDDLYEAMDWLLARQARRTRHPLSQHLPGSGRPLGPAPVCAHRADANPAPRHEPHRIVPSTGNLRKLKNPNPNNQLRLAQPGELRSKRPPSAEAARPRTRQARGGDFRQAHLVAGAPGNAGVSPANEPRWLRNRPMRAGHKRSQGAVPKGAVRAALPAAFPGHLDSRFYGNDEGERDARVRRTRRSQRGAVSKGAPGDSGAAPPPPPRRGRPYAAPPT